MSFPATFPAGPTFSAYTKFGFNSLTLDYWLRAPSYTALTQTELLTADYLSTLLTSLGLSKFIAFYPFLGRTAATHALNLVSAQNSITWVGTVIHGATGSTGDGIGGRGSLGVLTTQLPSVGGVGCYLQSLTDATFQVFIGARDTTSPTNQIFLNQSTGPIYASFSHCAHNSLPAATYATAAIHGYVFGQRVSSASQSLYLNDGTKITNTTSTPSLTRGITLQLMCRKIDAAYSAFTTKTFSACWITKEILSDAEEAVLRAGVIHAQDMMGRKVV